MTQTIKDTYRVISSTSVGEYKEKGSKFLAYAYPVQSVEDVTTSLEEVKSMHPKARHFCYAYRIDIDGSLYRTNDDGEPSGTAGKPIFGQMLSHGVSDTLIIVVRYFGGTKLGASGLINAYKTSAHEALTSATIVDRILVDIYTLSFQYGQMGHVMNIVKSLHLKIKKKVFEATPFIDIELPKSKTTETLINLKARLLQISIEQITDRTIVPFCSIKKISDYD